MLTPVLSPFVMAVVAYLIAVTKSVVGYSSLSSIYASGDPRKRCSNCHSETTALLRPSFVSFVTLLFVAQMCFDFPAASRTKTGYYAEQDLPGQVLGVVHNLGVAKTFDRGTVVHTPCDPERDSCHHHAVSSSHRCWSIVLLLLTTVLADDIVNMLILLPLLFAVDPPNWYSRSSPPAGPVVSSRACPIPYTIGKSSKALAVSARCVRRILCFMKARVCCSMPAAA